MRTVVVSDIFGLSEPLIDFCSCACQNFTIVDPYSGVQMHFADEAEAYSHFMSNLGIQAYAEHLAETIKIINGPVNLVGFSVGASAIWQISDILDSEKVNYVGCFYGSQIRHQLEKTPNFAVDVFLPNVEKTFDVGLIRDGLADKGQVSVIQTYFGHGFMNKLSQNFELNGYNTYLEIVKRKLNSWFSISFLYSYLLVNGVSPLKKLFSLLLTLSVFTTVGCASSSDYQKSADSNAKAGEYLESIGQPEEAQRAYEAARKESEASTGLFPTLVSLFEAITESEK